MVFSNNLLFGAAAAATSGAAAFDPTLIGNSVWLDGSADGLTAPSSTFSAQDGKEFTLGTWFQLNQIGVSEGLFCAGANPYTSLRHDSDNKIYFQTEAGSAVLKTQAVFRDIGWYHILVSVDTTQSAASDRVKLFVNGTEQALDGTQPSVNHAYEFNTAVVHEVGDSFENGAFKGYLAQSFMIGSKSIQQGDFAITDFLDTFTLGTNGSQFIPKKHSEIKTLVDAGSSNSFLLQYENSSALGTDSSTNTNTFTATSMGSANQSTHTPSKVYATLNPLVSANATFDLTSGATEAISAVNNGNINASMVLPSTGVFYWEIERNEANDGGGTFSWYAGIMEADGNANAIMFLSSVAYSYYSFNGTFYEEGSAVATGNSWNADGDKVAFEFDADNGTLKYYKNNSLERTKTGLTHSGGYVPFFARTGGSTSSTLTVKFKQSEWAYTPPTSGALELVSTNIPTPSYQGIDYFDATLYEGNGGGQRVGDFVPFTDAYAVTNSVMFDDGDSRSLSLNPSSSATSSTVAAISLWLKLGNLGTYGRPYTIRVDGNNYFGIAHDADDKLSFAINNGGATILNRTTTRVFKDKSAWHNLVVIINNDGSVSQADRVKIFYDGVQIPNDSTNFSPDTCSLDGSSALNFLNDSSAVHDIGGGVFSQHYDGYVAEVVFLDGADSGSKLDATPFGQVDTSTNRWVAKDPGSYTFGNMGYYLEFKVAPGTNNGAGTDTSGRDNHFTSNGSWATSDQFTDCPSQNFDNLGGGQVGGTISEGNTKAALGTGGNQIRSNFNLNAGKWYVESDIQATNNSASIGLVPSRSSTFSNGPGRDANGGISYETDGDVFSDNVQNATAEASFAAGDVVQMAIDMNAKKVYFGKNNTFGGDPAAGTGGHFLPASILSDGAALITLGNYSGSQSSTQQINYGQFLNFDGGSTTNGFKFTPPTGFKAVNQDNLDDTASKLTALSLIKNRDADDDFIWQDRVMGASGFLSTTRNTAGTSGISSFGDGGNDLLTTNANMVQRFLQRGVQVGNDDAVNTSGESYVLWQWLLGESATTGSSITTGSPDMATTGIVSDANHFSIVQYTGNGSAGASFAHGLGSKPELVIIKRITGSTTNSDWVTSTQGLGLADNNYFFLQYNLGVQTSTNQIRTGDITNDLVVVGAGAAVNVNTQTHQAYCFRSVPGLCKVGSFTSANAQDGSYVSLGFKPRWILIKRGDSTARDWQILDTARSPINPAKLYLETNRRQAEATATDTANFFADILSDGFKIKTNSSVVGGNPMIYLAMADIAGNGTLPPIYGR